MGDVVDTIFQHLNFVGFLDQRVEADADLALTGGTHFVVVYFHIKTHLLHGRTHGRANVVEAVNRWHREVAALDLGPVANVAVVVLVGGRPGRLFGIDAIAGPAHIGVPFDIVEDKKLGLGAEERGVANAG